MKQAGIILLMLWVSVVAMAQQKPHYTQYILNQFIVNPAIAGIENYTDIKLSHRHQWTGIQDAPVTTYLTIHGPIGKNDYRTSATSFEVPGENPRGKRYWEEYTAAEPHHGVGMQVINDVTGPLRNFAAYGVYAYHIGLSPRTSLSGGLGAGISRLSLDATKLDFGDVIVDPSVYSQSSVLNKTRFDMMAGLYLYSSDYFIGLSAQQIVPSKINFTDNTIATSSGKSVPHIFATAGYRFLAGADFTFTPSVMLKYITSLPPQYEANVKLQYHDLAWVGAGYRYKDGFNGMLGLNVSNTFNVSYAYDYTTSRLNNFTKGTHEVMIGFLINNKYGDSCPRNIW